MPNHRQWKNAEGILSHRQWKFTHTHTEGSETEGSEAEGSEVQAGQKV